MTVEKLEQLAAVIVTAGLVAGNFLLFTPWRDGQDPRRRQPERFMPQNESLDSPRPPGPSLTSMERHTRRGAAIADQSTALKKSANPQDQPPPKHDLSWLPKRNTTREMSRNSHTTRRTFGSGAVIVIAGRSIATKNHAGILTVSIKATST